MKTISMINIKGGVGKTTSAIAFAQILKDEYHNRVLVIDADAQGSISLALGIGEAPELTTAELLTSREHIGHKAIIGTDYGIDLIPADLRLVSANREVLLDAARPQQLRLKQQLDELNGSYDFCIIDCPPDINIAVINSLAITNDILIPLRADKYSFYGLSYITDCIRSATFFNPGLRIRGCFLTMLQSRTNLAEFSTNTLAESGIPVFKSTIRHSTKIGESTFNRPIMTYAPKSRVADDYRALVNEYINFNEVKK